MQPIVILLILLMQLPANAKVPIQGKQLEQAVYQFNHIGKTTNYQQVFVEFEQLYAIDKTNWLIPYYASIIKSRMCLLKIGNKEQNANEAIQWASKAKAILINDEIYCAESLAFTAKMSINPFLRWLSYEDKIIGPLKLAKKMAPTNPRIYLLEANIQLKLPTLFGGGCKSTIPLIQKSELYFNKGNMAELYPSWGKQSLMDLKKACPF